MKYFTGNLINLDDRYANGVKRGDLLGFINMADIFSVKLGSTLYLYGSPASGKTQLKYEILIQLSELYGYNHLIYDPETGTRQDIKEEVVQMIAKADFTNEFGNQMTEDARMVAEHFFDQHFFIIDTDEDIDLIDFFEQADKIEKELNIKLHTRSIDPYDYLKHNYQAFGEVRDDKYLMEALKYVKRNATKNNCYNILVHHVRDIQPKKSGNTWYSPPPTPYDLAFGQEWYRKGMAMIGIWRPKEGLKNDNGEPYENNESLILFGKLKPKGVSVPTNNKKEVSLYYDQKKHRYYEKQQPFGSERFAAKINFGSGRTSVDEGNSTFLAGDQPQEQGDNPF